MPHTLSETSVSRKKTKRERSKTRSKERKVKYAFAREFSTADQTANTSETIPDTVETIGVSTFSKCTSLQQIDSATSIGEGAL
jgi:hypothetical protein